MLPLIDTVIGFAAIMLVLSLLVKTLTSLVKNHVDFYSTNLKHEMDRLALAVLGKTWVEAVRALEASPKTQRDAAWFRGINWERLGDDFLTKENMTWLLSKLGADPTALDHLEDRLQVHVANISYAFSTRMKNLALVIGLLLCLALDVNCVTIWQTLYSDQQLRTTFATTYARAALQAANAAARAQNPAGSTTGGAPSGGPPPSSPTANPPESLNAQQEALSEETQSFMSKLIGFQKDVNFGVGRIWRQPEEHGAKFWGVAAWEFLGSLATGVMISIGAAYWHDLLRTLASLRQSGA